MKVYAFILGRNLVNFKCSRMSNAIHHLVWCTVLYAQSPYTVWSIVYLNTAYQSLSQIDVFAPHFRFIPPNTGAYWTLHHMVMKQSYETPEIEVITVTPISTLLNGGSPGSGEGGSGTDL